MKYLCIDPGFKHTGVAISEEGIIATPLSTIEAVNLNTLLVEIIALIKRTNPSTVIIGQPVSGQVHQFAADIKLHLESRIATPVLLQPEDLSSKMAKTKLVESGVKKSRRQLASHQSAAAIILQDYLDSK